MLTEKFIGRVATDLQLQPLYDQMLGAASRITIDRIQSMWSASGDRPSFARGMMHLARFDQRRNEFLRACRRQGLTTPRGLSLEVVERHILRQLISAISRKAPE